jgi:hypothetical protein
MFVPFASNSVNVLPGQAASFTANHQNGGSTTLNLPAGSVNVTTTLVYTALQNVSTVPANMLFADHAFELNAYQGGVLQPGFAFNLPMNVTIDYTEAGVAGIDEATLVLMYWNGSAWVDVATTCSPNSTYTRDAANNTLSIGVCHLTEFGLFGEELVIPTTPTLYFPLLAREAFTAPPPAQIGITTIMYAPTNGSLEEYVRVVNSGGTAQDMTGWTLEDNDGHVYTFPSFTLGAGGAVQVWTKAGTNSATHLYWNSVLPYWNDDGDMAFVLKDSGNTLVDECEYAGGGTIHTCQ